MTPWRRIALWLVAGALVSLAWMALPLRQWTELLAVVVRDAGALGVALFAVVYVLSALVLIPATLPVLAAGWIWGLWKGVLFVHFVGLLADYLPFAIARRLRGRDTAPAQPARWRLEQLDQAISHNGFWVVCLLRWSPILPFNVVNYVLGLTRVSTRDYIVATFVACIPSSFIFVYMGCALASMGHEDGTSSSLGPIYGLIAGTVSFAALYMLARRALARRQLVPENGINV